MSGSRIALFLPSLAGGGAERVFVQLANGLASDTTNVDLVLAEKAGPYLGEIDPQVRVIDLGCRSVSRALPHLVSYLRKERPGALLSALDHANVVAVLASRIARCGVRCVIAIRSVPSIAYRHAPSARSRRLLQIAKLIYPFADAIVANSGGVADDASAFYRIPRGDMEVIYNPIDCDEIRRLARAEVSHPWLEADPTPLVLGAGRLDVLKDFPTLIHAFALASAQRECRLAILGEGGERAQLERLVARLGLQGRVLLPGFVTNPFAWMGRARVFVSASLSEGCPNVLLQALACGTAVVSTDSPGGAAEILEGGKWGSLVPVGDAGKMSDAIVSALLGPPRTDTAIRAGEFSLDQITARFRDVLNPGHSPDGVNR